VVTDIRVGARVRVPWGLSDFVEGEIVEVWGDPPRVVRVRMMFGVDEDGIPETSVLPLPPDLLEPAA
jgi:hypothetical protein